MPQAKGEPSTLTEPQRKFVENYVSGMNQTQAARQAGYKHPGVEGTQLMKSPKIIAALDGERRNYERASMMTRRKVIEGLQEAIADAKTLSEPSTMVAGWREIARICGYFAPETKQINISVSGATRIAQLEDMSDEELAKTILEGEFAAISTDDEAEQALLDAPNGPERYADAPEADPEAA